MIPNCLFLFRRQAKDTKSGGNERGISRSIKKTRRICRVLNLIFVLFLLHKFLCSNETLLSVEINQVDTTIKPAGFNLNVFCINI